MKNKLIALIFGICLCSAISSAQNGHLTKWDSSYQDTTIQDHYYSWKIENIDSILIVAEGYADGIDYSFYKIHKPDSLTLISASYPVIIDTTNKSSEYYWGYPWDIEDIKIKYTNGGFAVLSSVEHSIVRVGIVGIPEF